MMRQYKVNKKLSDDFMQSACHTMVIDVVGMNQRRAKIIASLWDSTDNKRADINEYRDQLYDILVMGSLFHQTVAPVIGLFFTTCKQKLAWIKMCHDKETKLFSIADEDHDAITLFFDDFVKEIINWECQ